MIKHDVAPVNDLLPHFAGSSCFCNPMLQKEEGIVRYIHNSWDGREDEEEDGEPIEGKIWALYEDASGILE